MRLTGPFCFPDPDPSPSDPLPVDPALDTPAVPAARPSSRPPLTCEFCESKLSASGEVLKLSPLAAGYRDADFEHTKKCKRLQERIDALETELAAERAKATPEKKTSRVW